MRPIDKGTPPAIYTDYQDAKPDLLACLGDYCSYCERRLETHLAIEHVKPQSIYPQLQSRWSNLLLACVHCNSSKGHKDVIIRNYFWPDRDNTLRALEYVEDGLVRPHADLGTDDRVKAQDTIVLTGLDKFPGSRGRQPTSSDDRWQKRREVWKQAERARGHLSNTNTIAMREQIVDTALARGMFSIWWTVFSDDIDMRRRLREAFRGTHGGSFDSNENLLPRAGGQL